MNTIKACLFSVLLAFFSYSTRLQAQIGWSAEATPTLVFSRYNIVEGGLFPASLIFHKVNPSWSVGASVFYAFNQPFTLRLGMHYLHNNHRETYYRDAVKQKNTGNKTNINTSYFEPKLSLKYEIPLKNINGVFVDLGIGFFKPNSKNLDYGLSVKNTNVDGFTIHGSGNSVTTETPPPTPVSNTSPLRFYVAAGKNFSLTKDGHRKHISLDVMFIYRYAEDEIEIKNEITDTATGLYYNYKYRYASPYIGISFRFNSLITKQTE